MPRHPEETYPLLLLFIDEETARGGRAVHLEKGRCHGIATGASAVITQWPSE